jgi:putative ABC transport system permease protein
MIRTSWSTFRDRWQLFVGAISATAIGVALVQASLLTLLSAVHPHVPPGISWNEELVIREGYAGAVSLAAIMMAISTFVAVFVVSSTFAFTVAQRRRDFALLRLIGAQPRDVRRLVRGEAVTLGALGAGLGVPLGRIVAEVQR